MSLYRSRSDAAAGWLAAIAWPGTLRGPHRLLRSLLAHQCDDFVWCFLLYTFFHLEHNAYAAGSLIAGKSPKGARVPAGPNAAAHFASA